MPGTERDTLLPTTPRRRSGSLARGFRAPPDPPSHRFARWPSETRARRRRRPPRRQRCTDRAGWERYCVRRPRRSRTLLLLTVSRSRAQVGWHRRAPVSFSAHGRSNEIQKNKHQWHVDPSSFVVVDFAVSSSPVPSVTAVYNYYYYFWSLLLSNTVFNVRLTNIIVDDYTTIILNILGTSWRYFMVSLFINRYF